MNGTDEDLLDLVGFAAMIASGWRRLLVATISGALAGLVAILLIPPLWEGRASVLTSREEPGMLGGAAGGATGLATRAVLGGSLATQTETDLALLRSRRLLREVGEEVPIAARVRSPRVPLESVVRGFVPTGSFRPLRLKAVAEGDQWRIRGVGIDTSVRAEQPIRLPVGTLTLAATAPSQFALTLYDVAEGLSRSARRVEVTRDGGNVLEVAVRWDDSVTGARIANALVTRYLVWRREADAGDNTERLQFVTAHLDSNRTRMEGALQALRRYQEQSGVLDPERTGEALLEVAMELNEGLRTAVLETQALDSLLSLVGNGAVSVRALTGFPTFVKSQALNDLLTELVKLESERATLLATRTPDEPSVMGIAEAIRSLEAQLLPMARTYRTAVTQNRASMAQAVDSVVQQLAKLPGQGERYFLLFGEVKLRTELSLALETQLAELRLATVAEGGTARQVDEAVVTRKPVRPHKVLTILGGSAIGLLFGLGLVLFVSPRRRSPSVA